MGSTILSPKSARGINVYSKHRSKECILAMLAQSDDAQRSQGEYSKYGHDKLTAHEESADKEISILTQYSKQHKVRKSKCTTFEAVTDSFLPGVGN